MTGTAQRITSSIFAVTLLGTLGTGCGGDTNESLKADDTSTVPKSEAPTEPVAPAPSEEPAPSGAPACEPFDPARVAGLKDGVRAGVKVAKKAYAFEVEDGTEGYLAVAVEVTKGGSTEHVVLAAPVTEGEALTMATEGALPYFVWGDMATDGSPADELRDAVEASDAAQRALACF